MALQNLELAGKKARFDRINPFDKIAFYTSRQAWLERWDVFRGINRANELECPGSVTKEITKFLSLN